MDGCVRRSCGIWNVVATVRPRGSAVALRALGRLGAFRHSPYRGVLIGTVDSPRPAAAAVAAAYRSAPEIFAEVVRMIPLEANVRFERDDVTEALCIALESQAWRVAGTRFYVRARLRGLKGRVEAQAVERALGGFLVQRAEEFGRPAEVCFDAPDMVVTAEVIGKRVGYGLLDRETLDIPIVRPR